VERAETDERHAGVVEHALVIGMASLALVGRGGAVEEIRLKN
jgi:Flp pilus assembly pilin Flp